MKKTIFSTFLFILFLIFLGVFYLSFFGYETNKFNKIIKSEFEKSNNNISLDFKKIPILLDIKNLVLFVKFINPNINYQKTEIPLKFLRANIDLDFLTKKKFIIQKVVLSTKYLDFKQMKPILLGMNLNEKILKNIKSARFQINDLNLEFDKNFKLNKDLNFSGKIDEANIKILDNYEIRKLSTNFLLKKNLFSFFESSWNFNDIRSNKKEFFDGKLDIKEKNERYDIDLNFNTYKVSSLPKIPIMNYSFSEENLSEIKAKILINKNKSIFLNNLIIKDKNNKFYLEDLSLSKDYNLTNFKEIQVKTFIDDEINNEFEIINKDKITIKGEVFDAKQLIKELSKDGKKNQFFNKISKEVEIDFDRILKGAKFPIKNFRLIGKLHNGSFQKILAKSDFDVDKHLDISLKKNEKTNGKILEVYSDIATPLLSDYNFFQGLEGGNLNYISNIEKNNSKNTLTINNFKLNKAPALAKILSLADLKGLTDTLKGEGISFDTLSINFESNSSKMDIKEIFLIGPSISILVDGYIEKKHGLVSLRGTLVPAKTLNKMISKIPVVGDILIGKKVGEGLFGISFKIKGLPNNLKTTVNPVKTLTPRFITRALESTKKKEVK